MRANCAPFEALWSVLKPSRARLLGGKQGALGEACNGSRMAPNFSGKVRFYTAAIASVVICTTFPSIAPADDSSDVLAQHKAYVGWTMGDGTFKSIAADGAIVRPDSGGKETRIADLHTVRIGLAYRTTASYRSSVTYQGFTGSKFWYSTDSGFVVPLVTDDRFDILARGIVFGEAISQLPGVVRRQDVIDGVNVVVLRQTPLKVADRPLHRSQERRPQTLRHRPGWGS